MAEAFAQVLARGDAVRAPLPWLWRSAFRIAADTEAGLSAAAITRLTKSWSAELQAFMARDLSVVDYVYLWVDGIHFSVRLGDNDRLRPNGGLVS